MLAPKKNELTSAKNIIKNIRKKRKKIKRLISGVMVTEKSEVPCEYSSYTLTL